MARRKVTFLCDQCGEVQPRWMGKCPACNAWDSLVEYSPPSDSLDDLPARAAADTTLLPLSDLAEEDLPRLPTGIGELDRVLGGGLVPGCLVLLAGEPGIGKSTLALQAAGNLARSGPVVYATSEESARQVQLRARRLNLISPANAASVLACNELGDLLAAVEAARPSVLIVDSIQMIHDEGLAAAAGSVSQVRGCCRRLMRYAKDTQTCVILVGHVTKEGEVAGPRMLEHMVDVVLSFEGDRYHEHRVLRGVKNRFGATMEIGLFEMGAGGLNEVADGAGLLAEQREARPGSSACPVISGSRCFLVEIQALTASGIPGAVRRRVSGLDANRLAMLIAVLEKHGELRLADQDVFASAVGGLRVTEPAADLAAALAVAGAHLRRAQDAAAVAIGEVGLGGEIRRVSQMEKRLREAARLGYRRALVPRQPEARAVEGLTVTPVRSIVEALADLH